LAYGETLQAEALGLVAAKTRASLMIEGELPEEGLTALDGDGSDIYVALARRLANPAGGAEAHTQSLEALFAEARCGEDQADGLLVGGSWDDEGEVPQGPNPLLECLAPVRPGPLDDLPLFAADSMMSAPAGAPANSMVVTLERALGN
jgi:hypothetical protein